MAELRPDDAALRYQVANQLVQEGQAAAAIEHFKAAFKKEPSLFSRSYWQIENAFQQAGKLDELLEIFDQIDLRQLGRSYVVSNLISNMLTDESKRPQAMKLLRRAWEAFPEERSNLISNIQQNDLWQMPEMYDYARQGLIPEENVYSSYGEWNAFERILSYDSEGRVNSMVGRLLDMAVSQNRLDELVGQIETARRKFPNWNAGKALLALADCRVGRYDEARKLVREVLDLAKDEALSSYVPWIIGSELENHGAIRDLASTVYESCLNDRQEDPYAFLQYDNSPIKRLVTLYIREGRKEDARRVLHEYLKPRDFPGYAEEYVEQMRVAGKTSVAKRSSTSGPSPMPCPSTTMLWQPRRRCRSTPRTTTWIASPCSSRFVMG